MLQKMQLVRGVGITAALALTVVVSGCGGSGTKNFAPDALFQFGQPNFSNTTPNRGLNSLANGNSLNNPVSAAVAAVGSTTTFYVADTNNNRVLVFNGLPTGNTAAATNVIGQPNLTSNLPGTSDGSGTSLQLSAPTKVSVSPDGSKLLIVDSANNRVLVWNTLPVNNTTAPAFVLGDGLSVVSATNLNSPSGATFAPSATNPNRIIVADTGNNRVLVYNTPDSTHKAADYVLGQRGLGPTTDPIPGAVAPNPTTATSTGNSANCPQLAANITFGCDDGSGFQVGADTVAGPTDVWSDGFRLLVADAGNGRVLYYPTIAAKFIAAPFGEQAKSVLGQINFVTRTTSGGGAAGFTNPVSVYGDASNIYVADKGNNRVLAFLYPSIGTTGPQATSVYGQGDFSHVTANDDNQDNQIDRDSNGRPEASQQTLFAPGGMITVAGVVYILDSGNNRLIAFNTY